MLIDPCRCGAVRSAVTGGCVLGDHCLMATLDPAAVVIARLVGRQDLTKGIVYRQVPIPGQTIPTYGYRVRGGGGSGLDRVTALQRVQEWAGARDRVVLATGGDHD